MKERKKYSLKEIDEIVLVYKSGGSKEKRESLELLLDIFKPYFLKYVKLTKGGDDNQYQNREAKEFLRLFISTKGTDRKSFSEVKRDIAKTLESYEHEDIYQEFVMIFISLLNKYKIIPEVNFMRYITRYFRWHLRNYIVRVSKDSLFKTIDLTALEDASDDIHGCLDYTFDKYVHDYCALSQDDEPFNDHRIIKNGEITLEWVIKCDHFIFSKLTYYQRYLLYLYYGKSQGAVAIAASLRRSKDTISSHIGKIHKKIRILESRDN